MGKFDGILICTDLDGTLYRNDKTISSENKEAIEYFKGEGGFFTFITGRLPYYSTDAFEAVQPNAPFGCINGGGVYDGGAGRYVFTNELPKDALELVSYVDERFSNVGIQICGFEKTYFAKENDRTFCFRRETGLPNYTCDYKSFNAPIGKIIFCTYNDNKLSAIEKALNSHKNADKFDFIRSEQTLFEILPKGANKGASLEIIASYLKVDKSKTVAIGDYDNDVAMIKAAGVGIAVSNASKRAKDAADVITVSNEEHAIAKIINDIEKGLIFS